MTNAEHDFGPRSRRFTKPAYEHGGDIDLSESNRVQELVARHEELKSIESAAKAAAEERSAIDNELIALLGNADRGLLGDGRFIEAKVTRRTGFTVKPVTFRTLKIKKTKETQDDHY
jgi:hypothetical protein